MDSSLRAPGRNSRAFPAIAVGGFVAGTIDLFLAFSAFGRNMPRGIARGLVGSAAFQGGVEMWVLGIVLHYFIAFSAAAVYYAASRKLSFLAEHPFVCGAFFGIAIFLVMNLIVLPLSAIHSRGPFTHDRLIRGLLVHMFLIGLPIALSVRWFAGRSPKSAE